MAGWPDRVDGVAVDVAEAVAAVAEPGEIWCTGTVADLIAGKGVRWHDRGTVELAAGLGAWRLLRIGGDGASTVLDDTDVT